ncbi:MAG: GntR family transcriptional regulator [Flavobacteriales bacterium]|nr:GntR family transcriptional regulator [Flavobacteriales bacterium]
MIKEIGQFIALKTIKTTPQGVYLLTEDKYEILLPNKYVPKNLQMEDSIEVFLYTDSEDRPIATTLIPKVKLNEIAMLNCVDVTDFGAFFEWGVEKHLLVPFSEQATKIQQGKSYLVYLYKDELTNRLVGTTKFDKFLKKNKVELSSGDKVKCIISGITELGYKVIVEQKYLGLIYKNELFKKVNYGDELLGFVRTVRDDNKLDITLNSSNLDEIENIANKIFEKLLKEKGAINISDKSSPEEVYEMFQVSKKAFKKAIGILYSQRKIKINPNSIVLVS